MYASESAVSRCKGTEIQMQCKKMLLFQFLYMLMSGWMGVLYDNLGLKRGWRKHSFLNGFFLQSRHILLTKKKTVSASSLEQQILSLEGQRREVISSILLTFTHITCKTDITVSVTCPGHEIADCVTTVTYSLFMLQLVLPTCPAGPMFLHVGISSCALMRQIVCGYFLLCISSQA